MQSLMGETTAVAHGGDPQDRAASPRPRCIAFLSPTPYTRSPYTPHLTSLLKTYPCELLPTPYSLLPIPFTTNYRPE
ncbi:hypothetical protein [Moorena producens]|uniref:hypothetical protein n=1 Tax=Moorena producens TaxID=1155739 RepID=UPI001E4C46C3|nr:hypothetical protein [Moorena producens]